MQYDGAGGRASLIAADSRLDDEQLDLCGTVELPPVRVVDQGQRPVGPAQRPLGVGHQRQVTRPPGEPPRGPQLGQGVGPAPGPVGGHPGRLAHDANPRRELAGVDREVEGAVGVRLGGGGHQPARHRFRELPGQRPQLGAGLRIELVGGDAFGKFQPSRAAPRGRRAPEIPVLTTGTPVIPPAGQARADRRARPPHVPAMHRAGAFQRPRGRPGPRRHAAAATATPRRLRHRPGHAVAPGSDRARLPHRLWPAAGPARYRSGAPLPWLSRGRRGPVRYPPGAPLPSSSRGRRGPVRYPPGAPLPSSSRGRRGPVRYPPGAPLPWLSRGRRGPVPPAPAAASRGRRGPAYPPALLPVADAAAPCRNRLARRHPARAAAPRGTGLARRCLRRLADAVARYRSRPATQHPGRPADAADAERYRSWRAAVLAIACTRRPRAVPIRRTGASRRPAHGRPGAVAAWRTAVLPSRGRRGPRGTGPACRRPRHPGVVVPQDGRLGSPGLPGPCRCHCPGHSPAAGRPVPHCPSHAGDGTAARRSRRGLPRLLSPSRDRPVPRGRPLTGLRPGCPSPAPPRPLPEPVRPAPARPPPAPRPLPEDRPAPVRPA